MLAMVARVYPWPARSGTVRYQIEPRFTLGWARARATLDAACRTAPRRDCPGVVGDAPPARRSRSDAALRHRARTYRAARNGTGARTRSAGARALACRTR